MIENGFQYHWLTAYNRGRMSGHQLDWNRQPDFFKNYPSAVSYTLPQPDLPHQVRTPFFNRLKQGNRFFKLTGHCPSHPLTFNQLAALLLLTSAPTAKSTFPQGEIWYRSNASAGALYPIECYLSTLGTENLPAGTYHYDLLKPALSCLRENLVLEKSVLADSSRQAASKNTTQVSTIILSAIFFRTAWKYRERAYRYLLLDCGHLLENLELALQFAGLDFETVLDFDDLSINQHLNLDENCEVSLALVHFQTAGNADEISEPISSPHGAAAEPAPESPVSIKEIIYPSLNEIHRATASSLLSTTEIWSGSSGATALYEKVVHWHKIPENIPVPETVHSYSESLSRRRSRRNFILGGKNLTAETLHLLLNLLLPDHATASVRLRPEIIFSVNGVADIDNGFYLLDYNRQRYGLLDSCDRRTALAAAALDQRWIANAVLQFIFFADIDFHDQVYGPRSYRHLNI